MGFMNCRLPLKTCADKSLQTTTVVEADLPVPQREYSDYFTDYNIPVVERAAAGFILPFMILASLTGCGGPPRKNDEPLPFPDDVPKDDKKDAGFPKDDETDLIVDAGTVDGGSQPACVSPCTSGVSLPSRASLDPKKRVCVSFADKTAEVGLSNSTQLLSRVVPLNINPATPEDEIVVLRKQSNPVILEKKSAQYADVTVPMGLSGQSTAQVAIATDLNNDSHPDLVMGSGSYGLRFFIYQPSTGKFVFQSGPAFSGVKVSDVAMVGAGIYVATDSGSAFFQKNATGLYDDKTAESGLDDSDDISRIVKADINHDGIDDIFIAKNTGPNRFFRGLTSTTWQEEPALSQSFASAPSVDAAWVEHGLFTGLHVLNWNRSGHFFMNESQGFVDRAPGYGLTLSGPNSQMSWSSLKDGQYPILALGRVAAPNLLYLPQYNNDGTINRFVESGYPFGMHITGETVSINWMKANADDKPDLLMGMQDGALHLFVNESFDYEECPQ